MKPARPGGGAYTRRRSGTQPTCSRTVPRTVPGSAVSSRLHGAALVRRPTCRQHRTGPTLLRAPRASEVGVSRRRAVPERDMAEAERASSRSAASLPAD